jgi:hypothetical protein
MGADRANATLKQAADGASLPGLPLGEKRLLRT